MLAEETLGREGVGVRDLAGFDAIAEVLDVLGTPRRGSHRGGWRSEGVHLEGIDLQVLPVALSLLVRRGLDGCGKEGEGGEADE